MVEQRESLRILVVEDDEDDYFIAQRLLAKATVATVDWARSYDEGLAAVTSVPYDVALVDYRLGAHNGLELLKEAAHRGFHTPFILLTGQGDRAVDLRAMTAGAADYLVKWEFDAPLLERSIRYALERERAQQRIREQAALLDKARDAISACDLEGRVIYWNKSAERLTGYSADAVMGRPADALLYSADQVKLKAVHRAVRERGKWSGELCQKTHDGGEIVVGADVETVTVRDGRGTAVVTSDGATYVASKAIICNVTPTQLYGRLIAGAIPDDTARRARNYRYGRADMQVHYALDAPPQWPDADLAGTAMIHVTPGLDGVSKAVNEAERGLLPETATIVVGQPAVQDGSRVPDGKALLWIQLQELPSSIKGDAAGEIDVPDDGTWTEDVREAYADRIQARLARHIPNLESSIVGRRVFSPLDLEGMNTNLVGGDPYSGACTIDQFLMWRPFPGVKNHETPVKGVYHIGASTHPGPGLGGNSGYMAARRFT